jgi:hypothetical protein
MELLGNAVGDVIAVADSALAGCVDLEMEVDDRLVARERRRELAKVGRKEAGRLGADELLGDGMGDRRPFEGRSAPAELIDDDEAVGGCEREDAGRRTHLGRERAQRPEGKRDRARMSERHRSPIRRMLQNAPSQVVVVGKPGEKGVVKGHARILGRHETTDHRLDRDQGDRHQVRRLAAHAKAAGGKVSF